MKKLLLALIMAFAFCGSVFAQEYTSKWAEEFDAHTNNPYETHTDVVAFIQIDNQFLTFDDNWAALEVGCFVGETCRGHNFVESHEDDYGDPMPTVATLIFHDLSEIVEVSFKMYDHENDIMYDICATNYLNEDGTITSYTVLTGTDNYDQWDYGEWGVTYSFTSPTPEGFTRTVQGYDDPEGRAGYALIASPIGTVDFTEENTPVTNLITTESDYDLFYFNQNPSDGLEWINQKFEGFTTLEAGKGYLYANAETTTITFDGSGNTEAPEIILEHASGENIEMAGWNLVGNPFGVDAFLERPFYTMNEETGAELIEGSGAIAPTYGVFVYAAEEEDGQPLTFTTSGSKDANLALNLSNGRNVIDRASVRFGEGRTLPKFQLNRNSTKVYIPVDNEDYAVVRSEGIGELPVNFKAESNGTYSLTLSAENVDFSYLHLIDNMTGADQDMLANPSYSFEAKTTDYASRFRLVFATGNDEDNFAFFSNGSLVVSNEGNATLQVIDVTGRIVKCESINGCANVNIDAASGVYMVRLVNGDNVKVQKVVK